MVDKAVLDYLKTYSGQYPLDKLKKKLLDAGYSTAEIKEGISKLGIEEHQSSQRLKEPEKKDEYNSSGVKMNGKWMYIAGIIGFVLCGVYLISFILGFFNIIFPLWLNIIIMIFSILIFISLFFYYYGFIRLGKATKSKLIGFSAWATIVLLGLFVVLVIVMFIIGFSSDSFMLSGFATQTIDLDSSFHQDGMTGMQGQMSSEQMSGDLNSAIMNMIGGLLIFFGILLLFYLFLITIRYCFAIGLIKIRREVKFAGIAGILNLVLAIIGSLVLVFSIIAIIMLMINPMSGFGLIGGLYGGGFLFVLISIVVNLLVLASLFFEAITLLNASKRYE